MVDNFLDFNERCRLCIEPKRLSIDIFSEEGRRIKLESKINKHLSLQVSESDQLSHEVCYQCLFRLETWVSFKQLCMERDRVLKTWSQTFSKKIDQEIVESQSPCQALKKTNNPKGGKSSSPKKAKSNLESRKVHNKPSKLKKILSGNLTSPVVATILNADSSPLKAESPVQNFDVGGNEKVNPSADVEKTDSGLLVICNQSSLNVIAPEECFEQKRDHSRSKIAVGRKKSKKSNTYSIHSEISKEKLIVTSEEKVFEESQVCLSLSSPNTEGDISIAGPEGALQTNGRLSLKRKRGRPSKAFLLLERQLNRLKGKSRHSPRESNDFAPILTPAVSPVPADAPELVPNIDQPTLSHNECKSEPQRSPINEDIEPPQALSPELVPIVKEESGVTEIVLNDPDFGSMKFTLSIVGMDCPVPSPPSMEDYRLCHDPCELKEDFEGFESSDVSCTESTELEHQLRNEGFPSRSLNNVRAESDKDYAHSSTTERKRSFSTSGDFVGDIIDSATGVSCDLSAPYISKSLEDLHSLTSKKRSHLVRDDRSAHSDGEAMEI